MSQRRHCDTGFIPARSVPPQWHRSFKMRAMRTRRSLASLGMTIAKILLLVTGAAYAAAAQQKPSQPPAATPEQVAVLRQQAQATLSQTSGTLALAGLRQPVNVLRDKW